jgi:hypothetical protein
MREITMSGAISKRASAPRQVVRASGVLAGFVAAIATAALAQPNNKIPDLTSADFGWQSNVADWQEAPPGSGHGPIKPDPDHPYTSNAEAARTGKPPTKRIGNYKDPVLKAWAAAAMKASNDEALSSVEKIPFAAQARCYPGSVPGQLLFPFEPIYFIQTPKIVYMIWQRDHMVRHVLMTDRHSEKPKPSWFGESIGRYEGNDTLVVDTIGLSTKDSYIDNFHTPHTENLHVVERFTLDPDHQHLTAIVKVEDPDTFNAPLTMMQRWFKAKGRMIETVCAENNFDYFSQGLFPVPMADKPDF